LSGGRLVQSMCGDGARDSTFLAPGDMWRTTTRSPAETGRMTNRRLIRQARGISSIGAVVFLTALLTISTLAGSMVTAATTATAVGAATPTHPSVPIDTSQCAAKAAGTLCVRAAEDSIAPPPAPNKFDAVPHFKWLLNLDTTGTSKLKADGRTIDPNQDAACHPNTSTYVPPAGS
jgi:hypothetical protein